LADACAGDHAAVADQHELGETKSMAEFVDLGSDGFGVSGVAGEYFDGDGATLGVGEQAKDDLRVSGLTVAGVTEFGQRTMAAFEISGSQVIEHQAAVGKVAFGQLLLDARLPWQQPVHGLVEFSLVGGIDLEQLAETAVESVGVKTASGGEFGGRVEDAGEDHGEDEIALAAGTRIEDGIQLEVA